LESEDKEKDEASRETARKESDSMKEQM